MLELYFNKAFKPVKNKSEAIAALSILILAYARLAKRIPDSSGRPALEITAVEGYSFDEVPLYEQDGQLFYLNALMGDMVRLHRNQTVLFMQALKRIKRVSLAEIESQSKQWRPAAPVPECPLIEHAAKGNGALLTIATEELWKRETVTFAGRTDVLPNFWGQKDILPFVKTTFERLRPGKTSCDWLLTYRFNVRICAGSLADRDLTPSEWEVVFDLFDRAEKIEYQPKGSLLERPKGHGEIYELRHLGIGLRIFILPKNQGEAIQILLGGYYKKGMSQSQNHYISEAKKKIDNAAKFIGAD